MASQNKNFYTELPTRPHLKDLFKSPEFIQPAPQDWWVAVVDVVNSTKAIAEGRYRDVNVLSAALITAFINHTDIFMLPYTFAGDGASVLIPPTLVATAREVVLTIKDLAKNEFGLGMYGGVMPISAIREAGHDILVGKLQPCSHYSQAVFCGAGLQYAEQYMKSLSPDDALQDKRPPASPGLFNGLVCPWRPIHNRRGPIVNLIAGKGAAFTDELALSCEIIEKIEAIQDTPRVINPVDHENLLFARDIDDFMPGVIVKTASQPRIVRWLRKQISPLLLRVLEDFTEQGVQLGKFDFATVKDRIREDVDYIKYDGLLRLTTALSPHELGELRDFLDHAHQDGKLNYGMSESPSAVLTCYVRRDRRHLGLLDGTDGGFTRAAQQYKQQMRQAPLGEGGDRSIAR